ncbi:N2227-like protein-domain-containing protein [Aspergillus novoparasiticus]|uniref:N2227-like protein-domain-containing protein n=1 Tax=Aspergillus novoparasiticus TaxID=986946 RepID=A0A5N6F8U7_9EURO|nr:N2227-like protein-domain-containing protein [Aspergillus novoparasiticus]
MRSYNLEMIEYLLSNGRIKKEDIVTVTCLADDVVTLGDMVVLGGCSDNAMRFVDIAGSDMVASLSKVSMFEAFRRLSAPALKRLIEVGLPLTIREDITNNTILHVALDNEDASAVLELILPLTLELYNETNADNETVLGRAITLPSMDAVRTLIKVDGISPSSNGCRLSPLYIAVSTRDRITHVFVTNITLIDPTESRQQEEYSRLQGRLQRSTGSWDTSHPRQRLLTALHAFHRYKERNLAETKRWRDWYKKIPKKQRSIVESTVKYTRKLNTVEHLFETNERLAHEIVKHGMQFYNISQTELDQFVKENEKQGINTDKTSVSQVMKHFVRDWADEGHDERQDAFPCVLGTLANMSRTFEHPLRVLLPGAGLGRLAHEVNALGGFEVTMNEWSMYMNLAYRYLSSLPSVNSKSFHPHIDWWSHHATTADLQRSVSFPDTLASPSVVLVEGDFTTIFAEDTGKYDVIVTLFFIDTARNLVSYFENIHQLLRPGGQWINLGPLLYGSAPFLQLSLDETVALTEHIGFEFQETDPSCGDITIPGLTVRGKEVAYARNGKGLSKNAYQAQFWVARKN